MALFTFSLQVLSNPDSFDVAVTTYEMVNSADFGRPIQTSIVSGALALPCMRLALLLQTWHESLLVICVLSTAALY
jgi:hypothetical protein